MKLQETRNRLLRRAVITSLSGKGVSVITQLVAIPLAIGALGVERFGAYAMLTAIFLWTNTASSVVATALTLQIVSADAEGDANRESRLFSTAFFFALFLACGLAFAFQLLLAMLDIGQIFALKTPLFTAELRSAAAWMAVLLPANVVFSLAEATHAGYQRQYVNNILLTVANVFTIAGLLLVVQWSPSIQNMVLAMFLPATVSRVFNLLLLWRGRPHLLPRWGYAERPTLRGLLLMGSAFALTQIGTFFYQQFPTFYVGRASGLSAAAYLSTMMLVISISGSFLIIFTQPLMPALRDANARLDHAWIRRTHQLALKRLVPYITLAALAISAFGSFFVSTLTRQPVEFDLPTQCLWAAFFWIVAWEHIGYTFVVGMGRLWMAAWLYVLGSLLMLVASLYLVPSFGIAGAFAAMCLGPMIFTVVSYPRVIRRALKQARGTDRGAGTNEHSGSVLRRTQHIDMPPQNCTQSQYTEIRHECAIVAACDAKHAPFLFNAIASFEDRFPDHPQIVIYDIGLSWLQRQELRRFHNLELRAMPRFVAHWNLNWSWKLFALTDVQSRFVIYLDLANVVIQRSLAPWFLSIRQRGYLVISNGQTLGEITPTDYWKLHELDPDALRAQPTFGAGIIGFDRTAAAFRAIEQALHCTMQGLNLGRSATELSRNYRPDIVRDCPCFRADQTLLNLAFRQVFGLGLQVRRAGRYCGGGGPSDHPGQYLWYARRSKASLVYLFAQPQSADLLYLVNRALWFTKLGLTRMLKSGLARLRLS